MSSNDSFASEGGAARPIPDPRGLLERVRDRLANMALDGLPRVLPRSLAGDRIYALIHFIIHQRRLPRRRMMFYDYLLRLKLSGELLSVHRQIVSDKELCKLYVDNVLGPGRTIPTIAVLHDKDDVEEGAFPSDCVIKATHTWNRTIIRRNGAPVDLDYVRSFFDTSHYLQTRETNYRYLKPKVIVEPILFDQQMIELKIHCYKGVAKVISVQPMELEALERFDRNWNRLDVKQRRPLPKVPTPRPDCLDEVLAAAGRLAQDFEYIRVDAYVSGAEWIIGELTNCHLNIAKRFVDLDQERNFSRALFS